MVGIPANVTQVALLPVAYTVGLDFKPAAREPIERFTFWNRYGETVTAAVVNDRVIEGREDLPSPGDSSASQPLIMTPLIKNRSSCGPTDETTTKLRATPARLQGRSRAPTYFQSQRYLT